MAFQIGNEIKTIVEEWNPNSEIFNSWSPNKYG